MATGETNFQLKPEQIMTKIDTSEWPLLLKVQ